jgi:hypothetical protein
VDAIKASQASTSITHSLAKKGLTERGCICLETRSILSSQYLETILAIAKKNLAQDGFLQPVLFLQLTNGRRLLYTGELPKTSKGRAAAFLKVGKWVRREGKEVDEAMFLCESWFVDAQAPAALRIRPSHHPLRQEAIFMAGRDLSKTRVAVVVAPFRRDENNKPIWEPLLAESDNAPSSEGVGFVGLIDSFFAGYRSSEADVS